MWMFGTEVVLLFLEQDGGMIPGLTLPKYYQNQMREMVAAFVFFPCFPEYLLSDKKCKM